MVCKYIHLYKDQDPLVPDSLAIWTTNYVANFNIMMMMYEEYMKKEKKKPRFCC